MGVYFLLLPVSFKQGIQLYNVHLIGRGAMCEPTLLQLGRFGECIALLYSFAYTDDITCCCAHANPLIK